MSGDSLISRVYCFPLREFNQPGWAYAQSTGTGPQALGYADAAKILSAVIGKSIAYKAVDDETFVGMLTGAGAPEDYARMLATIFYPVREGWTAAVSDAVEVLTGKPPRSLETYAKDHAAELKV